MLVSPRGYHRWWRSCFEFNRLRRLLLHSPIARIFVFCISLFCVVDYLAFSCSALRTSYAATDTSLTPNIKSVFIASTHFNNEAVLRSHWNNAILELVRKLGVENVYVSVYESGSWDNSKGALRELDRDLEAMGAEKTIVLDPTMHEDEVRKPPGDVGWVDTRRGTRELRRIPYLSGLRNKSLEPLERLVAAGRRFDKVIFLNDVIFSMADIITLLNTRNGDYAAACSLDFAKPPSFYDTFALRDSNGMPAFSQQYPYFTSRASRNVLLRGDPVPVQSCWNGIAVFDAAPFQSQTSPLRFRGISDSLAKHHLEGSECCLIHFDNPLTPQKGVWLNPNVRVGYNLPAYEAMRSFPSRGDVVVGWFKAIIAGLLNLPRQSGNVARGVKRWEREKEGNVEKGLACLIDEMHVLVWNGWAHV